MKFVRFLKTPFPTEHLRWLLLDKKNIRVISLLSPKMQTQGCSKRVTVGKNKLFLKSIAFQLHRKAWNLSEFVIEDCTD